MQVFSQDFKEFLQFLNANNVDYLVIGGNAVGYYGYPRFTGDLDIWVRSTLENAQRILAAMDNFGFPTTDLRVEDSA